jgi:tricorn protease-like protein
MLQVSGLLFLGCLLAAAEDKAKPAGPTPKELARLIEQLGDEDLEVRRKAGKRLEVIGAPALAALREAARSAGDVDVRLRAGVAAAAILESLYRELRDFGPPHTHVQCVAMLRDGRVLSGGDDACLHLWDVEKGQLVRTFRGHTNRVMSVAGSPDGKQALTGGEDKTVRLWDLATGKELLKLTGHGDWVMAVEFSPDGRQALSCSGGYWGPGWKTGTDKTARLWDLRTGKEVKRFEGHTGLIFHAAFLPGGRRIVTCGADKTVRLWGVKTGKEVRRFAGHTAEVYCTAVSGDGKRLLSAGMDKTVRVWDVTTGKAVRVLQADTGFNRVALTPDGKRAVTSSWFGDGGLRLWDVETGKEIYRLALGQGSATTLALGPGGRRLVTGDSTGHVRVWRMGE